MIVLVDANVVFDVIGRRQPHYAASNQILFMGIIMAPVVLRFLHKFHLDLDAGKSASRKP
ncbi:MAG: hypothetical protein ABSG78_00280 [Verrucomicrobiota bacterium]|jgi:hypothetical protein